MLKRGVDVALAGLLLLVSLPLLAAAAIAIKLDSEGPVFFRQARMGQGFRRFHLVKLRSMRASIDGPGYTIAEDPRITRVGRWLRWFKVDELPQLWNVLRGEMSLVGPRPVVSELAQEFKADYERLLEVRPGLTDPATVKYCREDELLALVPDPPHYFKTVLMPDKVRLSAAYLERANVWRDLGVLVGTALALFPSRWWPGFVEDRLAQPRQAADVLFSEPASGAEAQPSAENV
ncbi:MAG TPA: sugar transferase [Terracidiphilus sp.]|nr:sugar transferase [Terracidiphilus sp.]